LVLSACRRIVVIGGTRRRIREDVMDGTAFDKLVQLVGGGSTRRIALKSALAGGTLAAVGLAASAIETTAKKKKKKCKKCKPKNLGEACATNKQCCTNETNRLCAFPSNPSSPNTVCCGGVGATCSSTDDCCGDFTCDGGLCDS
jgi:hypothetical protein